MQEESGPHWRAILEARWRIRLQEVTELSVTYHATVDAPGGVEDRQARRLLRLATEARQRLADTEDALGRLAAGGFGWCEQCGAPIPDALLTAAPESRYCVRCITGSGDSASAGDGTIAPGTVAGHL
jgi:DnaK suppressor protein